MLSQEQFLLDDFVSPKIIAGPHASERSQAAAQALRDDPDYRDLTRRLAVAGFFARSRWGFGWRIAVFAAVYLAGFAYLSTGPGGLACAIACTAIGLAHIHGNFVAHDAAHGAISKHEWLVQLIGQFFDSFLGGYSFRYFRRSHDLHHYHCNEIDHDPNTMARMFSLSRAACAEKSGWTALTTRWQYLLIPALYPLWSFALRAGGIAYVARNLRRAWREVWIDGVLLALHFALWFSLPVLALGWWGAVACYVAVTVITGCYLAAIVPINHVGMPMLDARTSPGFVAQQLQTTRNLPSSPLRDFLFMGQNSQIEHHLFPWVPTFQLGRGRAIIREFCRERGLVYHECSYRAALREVHRHYVRIALGRTGTTAAHAVVGRHDDLQKAS